MKLHLKKTQKLSDVRTFEGCSRLRNTLFQLLGVGKGMFNHSCKVFKF